MKWKRRRKRKEEKEEEIKNKTNQSFKTKNAYQTGTLGTVIWKINKKKMLSSQWWQNSNNKYFNVFSTNIHCFKSFTF